MTSGTARISVTGQRAAGVFADAVGRQHIGFPVLHIRNAVAGSLTCMDCRHLGPSVPLAPPARPRRAVAYATRCVAGLPYLACATRSATTHTLLP